MAGASCIRFMVFAFNLLMALSGLLILAFGALVQTQYYHYSNFVGQNVWTAPIIMMIIGVVVFIIGFLGCFGACKENSSMVLAFTICMVIIFITEIGIGIAGYIKHTELPNILEKEFNHTMEEYNTRTEYRDAWNILQSELHCCGINSPLDWQKEKIDIPKSCCSETPINEQCSIQYAYTSGCVNKLFEILDDKALALGGVTLVVAIIQLLAIFYACCLHRSFRMNYETV